MTQQQPDGISRRGFLRLAGITAAAAAATGGGAAWLKRLEKPPVITTEPLAPPVFPTTAPVVSDIIPAPLVPAGDDLLARLSASQAEVMRLQIANDQLQRDLAILQAAEGDGRVARDSLTLELEQTRDQLGILGGLVALYQQLDEADMGGIIESGLSAVGEKIGDLVGGAPALLSGLDAGERALGEVEAHLPALQNGRAWLDGQNARLRAVYIDVESRLRQALNRAGEFFELLAAWFEGLRRWLPFSAGERAAEVMRSLTAVLAEMPGVIDGLDANLARPLDVWLARENGEPALTRRLVKPLRETALAPARAAADQAAAVGTAFEQHLAAPGRAALNNRATLHEQIAAYREQYRI